MSLIIGCFFLIGCEPKLSHIQGRPVVKINNAVLTAEEFSELLSARLKIFNTLSAKDSAVVTQAKNAVIQDYIVRVVTEDWTKQNKIFVRKEQIDTEVAKFRKNYPDDISFRRALAAEGLTYDRWEDRVRLTVLEQLVIDELRKQIKKPTTEEMKEYYQANKASFSQPAAIRLRQVVTDTDVNAQKMKKELSAGKSLASLAKKFSISPEGDNGGDVGWVEKGSLDLFDDAFRFNVGQRSGVVKSPYGYHIYEVIAKRQPKNQTFEEAQKSVAARILAQREQAVYSSWLEDQILKARVFKDDDLINKIIVQTRSIE